MINCEGPTTVQRINIVQRLDEEITVNFRAIARWPESKCVISLRVVLHNQGDLMQYITNM